MPTEHRITTLFDTKADNYRAQVVRTLLDTNFRPIRLMAEEISRRNSNFIIYTLGNGGSASTASHLANDLLKMCGFPVVALPDMTPTTLAYMNDHGQEHMFSVPLSKFLLANDIVIAFSCSGESKNVLRAAGYAKQQGALVIAFTGDKKNKLSDIAGITFHVRHSDIRIQEDMHLIACHNLCQHLIEKMK